MSIILDDEGTYVPKSSGTRLYGVGRFFAAQFGARSSAHKLNATQPELLSGPLMATAQTKLEIFRCVVSHQMAQGQMMHDSALVGVALKTGKKKKFFGHAGVALAGEAFETIGSMAQRAGSDLFLISGTLLGPVREGHLLEHDYDLDFGIFPTIPAWKGLKKACAQIHISSCASVSTSPRSFLCTITICKTRWVRR